MHNINSITLNTQAVNDNHVITKAYVHQFHKDNERNRRDVGLSFYNEEVYLVKNNQSSDFNDNKLTNLDSNTNNRNPSLDNELVNKLYVDNELDKNTSLRFNQTLENYPKISVGNDTYNSTKYDKIQLTDTTHIRSGNAGSTVLQGWKIICNDKNNNGKLGNFKKTTRSNSPTGQSGATSKPPLGKAFTYIETSGKNRGNKVFVSFERTDFVQITDITIYYNRFSSSKVNLRGMGRFRVQLILEDNTWSTRYNIPKNDRYSDSSTDWTLVSLNVSIENYGIKLIYDQIDSAHADMCFSIITTEHSVD